MHATYMLHQRLEARGPKGSTTSSTREKEVDAKTFKHNGDFGWLLDIRGEEVFGLIGNNSKLMDLFLKLVVLLLDGNFLNDVLGAETGKSVAQIFREVLGVGIEHYLESGDFRGSSCGCERIMNPGSE